MAIKAVVFDLGGVVFESPLAVIAGYEVEHGIEPGSINRAVAQAGEEGAWARHERGLLSSPVFARELRAELVMVGIEVDPVALMRRIQDGSRARPEMLAAIDKIRRAGLLAAALTNNWPGMDWGAVREVFDLVVESVVEGIRKPDPEIFRRTLSRLGVSSEETVFLDDIGANLKVARALGMTTIKVDNSREALAALGELTGIDLTAG